MANTPQQLEPRWPALLALLAVGGLRLALPESLSAGPDWLLLAVVGLLLIPIVWSRLRGLDRLNKILGYIVTGVVTLDMIWSLYWLVAALPSHKEPPQDLLRSAAALWVTRRNCCADSILSLFSPLSLYTQSTAALCKQTGAKAS
jgi:hypothetical protein